MAPGISGKWPEVIRAPHTRHGRLRKVDDKTAASIDAAPELLAAVIEARDVIRDYQLHHDDGEWCKDLQESLMDTLEHAITKATGQ